MLSRFEDWKGRGARLTLAVLVHILAVLFFYYLSPPIRFKKPEPELQVTMLPKLEEKAARPKAKAREKQRSETAPKPSDIKVPEPIVELPMMSVSSDVFRASDISRIKSSRNAPAPSAEFADGAQDGSVGTGPDGAPMYDAELIRAPSFEEVFFYMPKEARRRSMSGTMLCKMLTNETLGECREVEDDPPRTGMSRAMRQSAYIFRVRPYRIGKKPIPGVWVRVKYSLIVNQVEK